MQEFDSTAYVHNEALLGDMYEKFNTCFYNGGLPGASMSVDVVHGYTNYRFAGDVIKTPYGVTSDEIAINGAIMSPENIRIIAMNILDAMVEQWEYHQNEVQLISRNSYKNDKYKRFAETHGLVVRRCDNPNYRWEAYDINDDVETLIVKYRWAITSQRKPYTYGDKPVESSRVKNMTGKSKQRKAGNSHRKNAECSRCGLCSGQVLGASRSNPEGIVCTRLALSESAKRFADQPDILSEVERILKTSSYSAWEFGALKDRLVNA